MIMWKLKAMEDHKMSLEEDKLRVIGDKMNKNKLYQELKIMFINNDGLDTNQVAYVDMIKAQF